MADADWSGGLLIALDGLLALVLIALAWACVVSVRRISAVLLFTGFGTLMALAWARLGAPDLALAEAALGAGVTGALFVAAWSRSPPRTAQRFSRRRRIAALSLAVLAMAATALAVLPLLAESAGLAQAVGAHIERTGVSHPVTAVLVDFRGFDTLLELAVLLAALVATWRLGLERAPFAMPVAGSVASIYARIVVPALVLLAGVLLWRGAGAPGGAFQAGATLAAVALLLMLVRPDALRGLPGQRLTVCLGVALFGGLGLAVAPVTGRFMDWPDPLAGSLVLLAEAGAALAIGLTLAALVIGLPGVPREWQERPQVENSR